MRISGVQIGNFKGIGIDPQAIEIKPLTFFFGANSSGKSSCLHALAALSQSLKLPNNTRALTLDDEFADVHLGRFKDAIHSKSYQDVITLGIRVEEARYRVMSGDPPRLGSTAEGRVQHRTGPIEARYTFKSTLRTQDVSVQTAELSSADGRYLIKRPTKGDKGAYTLSSSKDQMYVSRRSAFIFGPTSPLVQIPSLSFSFQEVQNAMSKALMACRYLGPFRIPPSRRYATRGTDPIEVGALGEATVTMLANETIQSNRREHLKQISKWVEQLNLGTDIEVARIGGSDLFETNVKLADGKKFALADLGYGVSQVLPVLAQCSFAKPGQTLMFEQPELHLHPLAARRLTSVFAEIVKGGVTVIAETHAPEMVVQACREVKGKRLSKDNLAIYEATRRDGRTHLEKIEVEDDGDVYTAWGLGTVR